MHTFENGDTGNVFFHLKKKTEIFVSPKTTGAKSSYGHTKYSYQATLRSTIPSILYYLVKLKLRNFPIRDPSIVDLLTVPDMVRPRS